MKNIKRFLVTIFTLLFVFFIFGCGEAVKVSTINVDGEGFMKVGETQTLIIEVKPDNAENKEVEWSSSDNSLATVSDAVVTALAEGTVTITAKAKDGDVTGTISIIIEKKNEEIPCNHIWDEGIVVKEQVNGSDGEKLYTCSICGEEKVEKFNDLIPESIEIICPYNVVEVDQYLSVSAKISPSNAIQTVNWISSDLEIATINNEGFLIALKPGNVEIKAVSTVSSDIFDVFEVEVIELEYFEPVPDLESYQIVIMAPSSMLKEIDPFLESYTNLDKIYKQKAWQEVEDLYNCEIVVKSYPDNITSDESLVSWISENSKNNNSQCDIAVVPAYLIDDFAKSNVAIDVTKYYNIFGLKQMEPAVKEAGSYNGSLYVASMGMSPTNIYSDLGLFYNLGWLESLGVKNPAEMFNDGEWTYSGFESWVKDVQSKLETDEYVLSGHPYYYYSGMTNAAGVKVIDTISGDININSSESKSACDLIYRLIQAGCCDKNATWSKEEGSFIEGTSLITTAKLSDIKEGIWDEELFGDDTRYGFVPFPYPDNFSKENTRIGISDLNLMMFVSGNQYPNDTKFSDVYRVINEMFLKTVKLSSEDPNYDANALIKNSLKDIIDDQNSIEAIIYYDAVKVFYDPINSFDVSTADMKLLEPFIDVFYRGGNFDDALLLVKDDFKEYFSNIYG